MAGQPCGQARPGQVVPVLDYVTPSYAGPLATLAVPWPSRGSRLPGLARAEGPTHEQGSLCGPLVPCRPSCASGGCLGIDGSWTRAQPFSLPSPASALSLRCAAGAQVCEARPSAGTQYWSHLGTHCLFLEGLAGAAFWNWEGRDPALLHLSLSAAPLLASVLLLPLPSLCPAQAPFWMHC